jgi:hypothetical protein
MSSIQNLLESANPWKSLQSDAGKLASKWSKTGLLEGFNSEVDKNNMSILLENQAKQLVVESSATGQGGTFTVGQSENWAGIALPLVRKVFGGIAAKEFVSVHPMNLPSGLVFFLDFQYGTTATPLSSVVLYMEHVIGTWSISIRNSFSGRWFVWCRPFCLLNKSIFIFNFNYRFSKWWNTSSCCIRNSYCCYCFLGRL